MFDIFTLRVELICLSVYKYPQVGIIRSYSVYIVKAVHIHPRDQDADGANGYMYDLLRKHHDQRRTSCPCQMLIWNAGESWSHREDKTNMSDPYSMCVCGVQHGLIPLFMWIKLSCARSLLSAQTSRPWDVCDRYSYRTISVARNGCKRDILLKATRGSELVVQVKRTIAAVCQFYDVLTGQ